MDDLDAIEKALTLLRNHRVHRFVTTDWSVEFQPDRPLEEALPKAEPEDKRRCVCGHDLVTEHNQFGCIVCAGTCLTPEKA